MVEVPRHSLHPRWYPPCARFARRLIDRRTARQDLRIEPARISTGSSARDDPVEWKDVNFFDNPFDEALGEILLTSYSSSHDISLNAPDVSTGGDLPKRWTINKNTGRRLLVKSGRTGQEPMNEVIASKLCARLGVPAVPYSLARSGNRLVCVRGYAHQP